MEFMGRRIRKVSARPNLMAASDSPIGMPLTSPAVFARAYRLRFSTRVGLSPANSHSQASELGAIERISARRPGPRIHRVAVAGADHQAGLSFAEDWRKPWAGFGGTRDEAKAKREGRVPYYLLSGILPQG